AELSQRWIFQQGARRQVQQPRGNYASAPPYFGDIGKIQIVLIVLRISQGCRLRVDLMRLFADIGSAQDTQPLGIGSHDAVLDAIVYHLDEVAGTIRTAVQVPLLGGASDFVSPRGARDVTDARSQ